MVESCPKCNSSKESQTNDYTFKQLSDAWRAKRTAGNKSVRGINHSRRVKKNQARTARGSEARASLTSSRRRRTESTRRLRRSESPRPVEGITKISTSYLSRWYVPFREIRTAGLLRRAVGASMMFYGHKQRELVVFHGSSYLTERHPELQIPIQLVKRMVQH